MSKKDQINKNYYPQILSIDSTKPLKDVISEAEEKILSGDISNAYNEIEKTEKIISFNISRILIDIFNSIQVMNLKKEFVEYIKIFEIKNISQNDITFLEKRLNEYRNLELPKKWDEMKHKIQFTNKISHYKAWYFGLHYGRYKMVVTNVKEFIVKEIIKKILKELTLKYNKLNNIFSNLISLLDKKNIDIENIKNKFKKIYADPLIGKIKESELFIQFETYIVYYFYLNYDLNVEKEIVNKILIDLKNIKSINNKLDYLLNEKENITESIKDGELKNEIGKIFDKLIHLYNSLNEQDKDNEEEFKPAKKIENKKEVKNFIGDVMKKGNENFLETINKLDNEFRTNNLNYEDLTKNYLFASKFTTNKENKSKLNEIIQVIRRIQKEIDPLLTLECKIAKLLDWVNNEYKDKEHIKEVINNQIKDYILIQGREGGLLRELFNGLDMAKNKIKYLREMMKNIEYRHLVSTIKTLIENIEKESEVSEIMINEEWINKQLNGKNDDERLDWLKLRKYWQKYEKQKDFINNEIKKYENKFKVKKVEGFKIFPDIIDLAEYVLTLEGSGARQKFIKEQQEKDSNADETFKLQRKLLFYLMSSDTDEPMKELLDFTNRVTLSIPEKQKFLKLLKDSNIPGKGELKSTLNIKDEDIAFAAIFVLRIREPIFRRIKYLENLKSVTDDKFEKYKETFGINNKIISGVIDYLNKKSKIQPKELIIQNVEQEALEKNILVDINENLVEEIEEKTEIEESRPIKTENIDIEIINEKNKIETDKEIKEKNIKKETLDILKDVDSIELDVIKNEEIEPSIEKIDTDSFTEEEVKEWEKGEIKSIKSTGDLLKEQIIREEFNKTVNKEKEIVQMLEEKAIKSKQESIIKVKKRAREIHEDKNKKNEDKINELLSFLTTCFPEAISVIITNSILPVFNRREADSEVRELFKSINDSIFNPALDGKDVEDNINFLNKKLNIQNIKNIKTIVEKIKKLREELLNSIETHEIKKDVKINEIREPKSMTSVLTYLSRISPEKILNEIDNNLMFAIKDEQIRNSLKVIYNNLKNIHEIDELNSEEIKFMYVKLKFNDKDKKIYQEILHKIEKYKDNLKKSKERKKLVNPITPEKETIKEKEYVEPSQKTEEKDSFPQNKKEEELPENGEETNEIEYVLSGLTNFIKPHAVILDIVRKNKELNEEDYGVDERREIIDNLYKRGKIFTYDGSSYIGIGQISNIVKNNIIPTPEKPIFLHKLNEFLGRLKTKEEIYKFLGVKNEMEFKQLNYNLDKYGVGREPLTHIVDKVNTTIQEKRTPVFKKSLKSIAKIKTKPIMAEESKEEPVEEKKEKKSFNDSYKSYKEKLKEAKKVEQERRLSLSEMREEQKKFISKTQREILNEAEKAINKNLERLIKTAKTKNDLESVYRNYIGDSNFNKKNQLNLCYDIKKIANIIDKDDFLFSRLTFNQEKIKKMFDSRMKKFNR